MVELSSTTTSEAISSLPAFNDPDFHNIPSADHAPLRSVRSCSQTNLGNVISHIHRAVESREGHELALLTVGEAARLVAAILGPLGKAASRPSIHGSTSFAAKLRPARLRLGAVAIGTSARLYSILEVLEEWQLMIRMWGLLDMWMSAKELVQEKLTAKHHTLSDVFETTISALQTLSMTAFHIFEATACLSIAKVLAWPPHMQGKLMTWAARCWATFTFIEVIRHLFQWSQKSKADVDYAEWKGEWKTEFLRNLAWVPYTMHWSMPDGLLPDAFLALSGLYPCVGIMRDIWRETA
ncbi:hypothetical protein EDB81DRAFT_814364 [Dactylonectria macrodidyma]|uniref:Uncharacterized protein n=1 Tax=Dactylonectria macrodidyma TaxID=307937 RepID=A0A9P9DJX2_9HYPO|nr:hypothetical protein EDB81DRAFT_814364 [Dactylonectria macrodidyma]